MPAEVSKADERRPLSKRLCGWFKALCAVFPAALFMACLSQIPPAKWLFTPLETVSLAFYGLALHLSDPLPVRAQGDVGVVLITRERLERDYQGLRPLRREVLTKDLGTLLGNRDIRLLALDIDVSPTPESVLHPRPSADGPADRDASQAALDSLLVQHRDRLLLILPFPSSDPDIREAKADWVRRMCEQGLRFTDPRLQQTLGMVTHGMPHDGLALATHLRARLHGIDLPLAMNACELLRAQSDRLPAMLDPDSHHLTLDQMGLDSDTRMQRESEACKPAGGPGCPSRQERMIAYQSALQTLSIRLWCAGAERPDNRLSCSHEVDSPQAGLPPIVVFGGAYDAADEFITPLGLRTGAEVHAMTAFGGFIDENSWVGLGLDLLIGILFGYLTHHLWSVWFQARLGEPDKAALFGLCHLDRHSAWAAIAALTVSLVIVGIGLLWIAGMVLQAWRLWLSPLQMVVGMALDTYVTAGVNTAVELSGRGAKPRLIDRARAGLDNLRHGRHLARTTVAAIPWLVWLAVVTWALHLILVSP